MSRMPVRTLATAVVVLLCLVGTGSALPEIPSIGKKRTSCFTSKRKIEGVFLRYLTGLEACGKGEGSLVQKGFSRDIVLFFQNTISIGFKNVEPLAAACKAPPPTGFNGLVIKEGVKTIVGNSAHYKLVYQFPGFEDYTVFGVITVCNKKIVRITDSYEGGDLVAMNGLEDGTD